MKKIIAVDFYDLIIQQPDLYSPEDIDRLFAGYAELGIDTVLWRLSVAGQLLYRTATPDILVPGAANNPSRVKAAEVLKHYDPAEEALRYSRKHGIKLLFWITLYDDAGYANDPVEAQICTEHPEFSWRSKDGREFYHGVLSYTYPEVVDFRIRQLKEVASYGADGLYLCNRSHSRSMPIRKVMKELLHKKDRQAFMELMRTEYKRCRGAFGYDPPALATYTGDLDDTAAWQKHRGKYFTDFMAKVRREINCGKLWFGVRYAQNFGPYNFGDNFFDWERLTDNSLVDALAYDLPFAEREKEEDYPEFFRKTAGEKLLWMHLREQDVEPHIQAYSNAIERWKPHLDGIIMFEAYLMTYNPQYGEFIKNEIF